MTLQELLDRLHDVRPAGSGYLARCPAHQDHKPSLSVGQSDGRILLKCHAGCSFEAVRDALGLTNADLRTDPVRKATQRRIVATYDYLDEAGGLLYQVVRYQPKDFRQRRPDGRGGWVWNMKGVRRVLYHLPELMAADPDRTVYVVEGEKAADRLAVEGLTATCSPGGAGKWRAEYAESLRGRQVVVLPDNDRPGGDHAEDVARSLRGVAASVRVLELPGLAAKADVWDWLEAGHTGQDLERLASQAPEADPAAAEPPAVHTLPQEAELLQRDYGHAHRLSVHFLGRFRWATHLGSWMEWTGQVWRPVPEERVVKVASDVLRSEYAAELATAERGDIPRLAALLRDACTYARMVAALSFLRGWDGILTQPEEWDAQAWTLNLANGMLDLRSGQLRPHSPNDLCTKLAPVEYDPTARGEKWQAHLDRFLPDPEVQRQVRRDLGLSLTGAVLDEVLNIWYGTGANGKTTTARALLAVMGDYGLRAAPNLLVQSRNERHPTELADLAGSRIVFSVEVDEGKKLAEALVKDVTGGDRKKARLMRQDFFEFDQTWYITLIVNHKPIITGTDEGIWRRVRLIPWQVRIPEGERRPQDEVVSELVADGSGILNWLLAGLQDWQGDRHWVAPEVQAATEAYRAEQDVLGEFLREACELGPRYAVPVSELYETYAAWCAGAGEEPIGKVKFGGLLRQRGMSQKREPKTRIRRWVGIRLSPDGGTKGDKLSVSPHENDDFPDEPETLSPFVPPSRKRRSENGQVALGGNDSGSSYERSDFPDEPESLPPNATYSQKHAPESEIESEPAPFTPSAEWQDLPDGYVCPPGVEWRPNMTTGRNQVRWPDMAGEVVDRDRLSPEERQYVEMADREPP